MKKNMTVNNLNMYEAESNSFWYLNQLIPVLFNILM